ncbi:MAG: LysR family transcriptional regulator [Bacilli bacterium]
MDALLLTFVTIVERKNFTRAAEELHLTQSAVSREIQVLEKKYCVKLFDRTNKYVRLTKAGEVLYHHAKDILIQYDRAEKLINDLTHSAQGVLEIGSGYTFGEYLLPRVIQEFKSLYPSIIPKITIKNSHRIVAQVLRRELDIGIVEGTLEMQGLVAEPFAHDEMVVIVSPMHRLSGRVDVQIDELSSETWILRELGSGTREVTNRVFSDVGLEPVSIMEFGSSQVIKEAVEAGLGISVISQWAIRKEIKYGILSSFKLRSIPITRNFCYLLPNTQFRTRATDLFVERIAEMVKHLELS